MKVASLLIISTAFVASGCASNPRVEDLTSAEREKVGTIEIYTNTPAREYVLLGTVDGLSCNRNKHQSQDISDHEALEGIRIRAAILGADAVINTFCQKNSDIDWRNNCWASVKCVGDAVKF